MTPSPSIPRCKSVPSITDATQHSPSVKTSKSAESLKSALQKLNRYVSRKKWMTSLSSSSSSSSNTKLTAENLKEFNKRNALQDERKRPSSPYYKGLTDQSIAIEKQRLVESSPLRENYGPQSSSFPISSNLAVKSSSSSLSRTQISLKTQVKSRKTGQSEQGMKEKEICRDSRTDLYTLFSEEKPLKEKISSSRTAGVKNTTVGIERGKKEIHDNSRTDRYANNSLGKEKSLRERVSEQPPPLPPPPIVAPTLPPPQPPRMPRQISLSSPPPTPPPQTPEQDVETSSSQPPSSGKSIAEERETVTSSEESISEESETTTKQSETKFVWADKHRPKALKDFICNKHIALELQASAQKACEKHVIFEGPPGVGKRTMIFALLREIYGPDKVQAREECKVFTLKGEAVPSIQVNIKVSTQHVEINLSETKGYEQHVIVELIRGKSNKLSSKAFPCSRDDCKAIIICEAEKLSTDSLRYIKWILERYKGCHKVFFCCSDASKLQPIKSICTVLNLKSPSDEEIINVLKFIAKQEGVELPDRLADKFAKNAKRNLQQAIRSFEATWHHNSLLKEDQEIMTGWEDDITEIARNIIEEQSPRQLYDIRRKLQNLIEHNVSAEFIFHTLVEELKKNFDEQLQNDIDNLQQKYKSQLNADEVGNTHDDPLRKTVQQFMKIEEFIAKFMSWYKVNVAKKGKEVLTYHV